MMVEEPIVPLKKTTSKHRLMFLDFLHHGSSNSFNEMKSSRKTVDVFEGDSVMGCVVALPPKGKGPDRSAVQVCPDTQRVRFYPIHVTRTIRRQTVDDQAVLDCMNSTLSCEACNVCGGGKDRDLLAFVNMQYTGTVGPSKTPFNPKLSRLNLTRNYISLQS